MVHAVAIAVLERQGLWLLQLRDDDASIVAPGTWGLFGGHLEAGEGAEQALRRELNEEIGYVPDVLNLWFVHADAQRIRHVFKAELTVPLSALQLREGQDMVLASLDALRTGEIWSPRLRQSRPLAPSLIDALQQDLQPIGSPDSGSSLP